MNPLFNAMNAGLNGNGPIGNIQNFMSQLKQFRSSFQGNPNDKIQELLNSGKISQEQYNQCANMANQIMGLVGKN